LKKNSEVNHEIQRCNFNQVHKFDIDSINEEDGNNLVYICKVCSKSEENEVNTYRNRVYGYKIPDDKERKVEEKQQEFLEVINQETETSVKISSKNDKWEINKRTK
jgi:transcriptional antiterminator